GRSLSGSRELGVLISDGLRRQERFFDSRGCGDVRPGRALRHGDGRQIARHQCHAAGNDGSRGKRSGDGSHDERYVQRLPMRNRLRGGPSASVSHFYLVARFSLEVWKNLLESYARWVGREESNLALGVRTDTAAKHQRD